jgi:hypothetical protein
MRRAKYCLEAICQRCGKAFQGARKTKKFCTDACRQPLRIKSKAKRAKIEDRRLQRQPVELVSRHGGTKFLFQGAFGGDFEEFKRCMRQAFKKVEPEEQARLLKLIRGEGVALDADGNPRPLPLPKSPRPRLIADAQPTHTQHGLDAQPAPAGRVFRTTPIDDLMALPQRRGDLGTGDGDFGTGDRPVPAGLANAGMPDHLGGWPTRRHDKRGQDPRNLEDDE